jgi:outer membrane lipoprotein-sorting protein
MDEKETKLSDYIDQLNREKMPKEHEHPVDSAELEELFDTVRLVRTLKEPALPDTDYPKEVAHVVYEQVMGKTATVSKTKRRWFAGMVAVAAVVALAMMLNLILPFGRNNVVHAMEQAYKGVKAYHGLLEIVETNAVGKETRQAQLEVWADQDGCYYIKEIEGPQEGMITVNNGQQKWQIRPDQKQIHLLPAFPDPYRFTFELGKEIEGVKNALETKVVGEELVAGRKALILEVSPAGGVPYRIWIDQETNLPLQKQSGMQNALQYKVTYTKIDFSDNVPAELLSYSYPAGFKEIDTNPEQLVNNLEEAGEIAGFMPKLTENVVAEYEREMIAVDPELKIVKVYYTGGNKPNRIAVLQGKSTGEFKPESRAVLGKINNSIAEIQSPIEGNLGILAGGWAYAGVTDLSSVRWQEDGFEYAVVGDVSLEELTLFMKNLINGIVQIPSEDQSLGQEPQIEVPVDLKIEENEQKSVDAGHSPWRLDPVYVAQVFVSLKISPEGIQGEYPIKIEDLKIIQNTGRDVVLEVSGAKTPIRKVYLKRLIRQDYTGIWTVVGYDPVAQ